jgi:hypothetical protein
MNIIWNIVCHANIQWFQIYKKKRLYMISMNWTQICLTNFNRLLPINSFIKTFSWVADIKFADQTHASNQELILFISHKE